MPPISFSDKFARIEGRSCTRAHARARYSGMLSDMFCHQCGHENRSEAKFCDQCGASTAAPGGPSEKVSGIPAAARTQLGLGSPIKPASDEAPASTQSMAGQTSPGTGPQNWPESPEPQSTPSSVSGSLSGAGESSHGYGYAGGGDSMLSVSLHAIGLQPAWRAWTTVILILGAFTVGGGVLAYFLVGGETEVVGGAAQDDPFLIGAAEPVETSEAEVPDGGVEPSDQVDSVEAQADQVVEERRTAGRRTSARSGSSPRRATSSANSGGSRVTTVVGGRSATSASSTRASGDTGSPADQPTAASMEASREELPASAGASENTATETPGGTNTVGDSSNTGLPESGGIEDRDIEMSMYVSRVRFTVRRYYASRAQNCFDRATRNNPTLSGTAVVGLTIGSDGYVRNTRVARNSTGDASLGACLAAQARSWRLPVPPHAPLTVQLPFSR